MTQVTIWTDPKIARGLAKSVRTVASGVGSAAVAVIDRLLLWQERAAGRRHLLELEPRLLGDMGITRADAAVEAAKPFWRG